MTVDCFVPCRRCDARSERSRLRRRNVARKREKHRLATSVVLPSAIPRLSASDWRYLNPRSLCVSLVGRIDLARAIFGTAFEFVGHVAELVRMVLADQLAIRALDVASAGARDAEHGVRILAGRLARRAWPVRARYEPARAGARAGPVRGIGVAPHRGERGELVIVHAERPAQLAHERELGRRAGLRRRRGRAADRAAGTRDRDGRRTSALRSAIASRREIRLLARLNCSIARALLGRGAAGASSGIRSRRFPASDTRPSDLAIAPASANSGSMNEPRRDACRGAAARRIPEMADQRAEHDPERIAEQREADHRADAVCRENSSRRSRRGPVRSHAQTRSANVDRTMQRAGSQVRTVMRTRILAARITRPLCARLQCALPAEVRLCPPFCINRICPAST